MTFALKKPQGMGGLPGSEYHKREAEMAACHETEEERDLAQVPLFVFILLHLISAKEYPQELQLLGGSHLCLSPRQPFRLWLLSL